MPVRRLFAVGLWLCVTAAATAIVWAGTSTVAADLTDRPAPVIAHRDVVAALQPGASEPETTPGITTPGKDTSVSSASTGAPGAPGSPPAAANTEVPGRSGPPGPPPAATTPTPNVTPPTTRQGSPPSAPPTTQPPQRPTAAYSTAGGVVTVACNGDFFIELLSATPRNGYAANVVTAGPYYVEVHFVRGGQDDPVWAFCLGQPIRAYGGAPRSPHAPG
jgi:hypothetical protein